LRHSRYRDRRPPLRPCVGRFMPFKANASRRHHIPRQRHRVRNWAEYDAGLRARGSLTVWFTQEAVERWRAETRTTPGGQRTYSDLAITTALTLRAVFRLPLRQTEGLVGSIIHLLGVELAAPDHSTWRNRSGAAGAANALSPRKGSGFEGGGSPRCHSLVRPGAGTATAFEESRHGSVCRVGRFAGSDDGACPG
jgi:hypothetical protein